jgi:hypothetical protein
MILTVTRHPSQPQCMDVYRARCGYRRSLPVKHAALVQARPPQSLDASCRFDSKHQSARNCWKQEREALAPRT